MTVLDLTVEKRILLHLQKYSKMYKEAWEVPNAISQEGISVALDILLNNVSRAMKDLKTERKVNERLAHIKCGRRKRRAYILTEEGTVLAEKVIKELASVEVSYIDKDGKVGRITIERILGQFRLDFGEHLAYTDVVETIRRNGAFDSAKVNASLKAASSAGGAGEIGTVLVDMTTQAPRLLQFVGRAAVLSQLEKDLENEGPPIIVVHGMAGIGKTTLALKVLEDLRGKRNLFYYRFHTWDSLGNVATALKDLIVRMGIRSRSVATMLEMDLNELAMFLARELGTRPIVIVFDDFHKAGEDIVPLFRALTDISNQFTGMKMMIVTRTVPGFYSRKEVSVDKIICEFQLDGLDLDETKALLGEDFGQDSLERIHGLSRGVPLFLEILRSVDNVDAVMDIRKYVEEEIYSGLRFGERTVLEGLSVHRYPVSPEAVLVDGATFDDLSNLTKKSIVLELPHRRFEAHDLIKEFVYGRLPTAHRAKCHARAAEFYRSYQIHITEGEGALAQEIYYTQELAQIEAIFHMKRSGDVKGAATLMLNVGSDLIDNGHTEVRTLLGSFDRSELEEVVWADLLLQKGDAAAAVEDWPVALEMYEAALEIKKRLEAQKAALASIHGKIGMAQMHVERWEETVRSHENAFRMFEEAGDERGMARELMHLGMVFRNRKDWKRAEADYDKARNLLERLNDQTGLVVLHNNLAKLRMVKGDLKSADKSIAKAFHIANQEGNDLGKAVVLLTRGEMSRDIGRLDDARKDLEGASEIFRRCENHEAAIQVQLTLGDALLDDENTKDAQRAYLKALDIYQTKKGRSGSLFFRKKVTVELGTLGRIYDRLAAASRAKGDLKDALNYDLKALDCFETEKDQLAMGRKFLDAGRTCEDLEDLETAKSDFEKALQALSGTGDWQGIGAAHLNLARILEALGDIDGAVSHLELVRDIVRESKDRELKDLADRELRRLRVGKKGGPSSKRT